MHFCALFRILIFSASGPCNCFCMRECHLPWGCQEGKTWHILGMEWTSHVWWRPQQTWRISNALQYIAIYYNKHIPQTTPKTKKLLPPQKGKTHTYTCNRNIYAPYNRQKQHTTSRANQQTSLQVSMVARAAERFQAPPAPKVDQEISVATWTCWCCCCCCWC